MQRRLLTTTTLLATLIAGSALAQPAPSETPALFNAMAGRWSVAQRTWSGPDAEPTALPGAVAERKVAQGGGYLSETMTLADPRDGAPFTRTAQINRNATSGRFEYFSLDSRAPQQMVYQSAPEAADATGPLAFEGGLFVAAQWGEKTNVTFDYRLEVGPVAGDQQVVRLFLTPQGALPQREFLAFQYDYTRRP